MGSAVTKPSVAPTLVRNAGHQDVEVAPQLALVTLPIEMPTAKSTAVPTVMV
jgi:hypothetical protein